MATLVLTIVVVVGITSPESDPVSGRFWLLSPSVSTRRLPRCPPNGLRTGGTLVVVFTAARL